MSTALVRTSTDLVFAGPVGSLDAYVDRVSRIVRDEEYRYASTFQIAERFFPDEAKSAVNGVLPGAAAFKLYDTYGLALDEQEEMAREFGLTIDRENFTAEMEKDGDNWCVSGI